MGWKYSVQMNKADGTNHLVKECETLNDARLFVKDYQGTDRVHLWIAAQNEEAYSNNNVIVNMGDRLGS